MDKLILKELGMSKLEMLKAHRALAPKLQWNNKTNKPNKPPRAIIVNFLKFEVKENILKTAWQMSVEVERWRVTFDHNYAAEVASKHRKLRRTKENSQREGDSFQSPMDTLRVHSADVIKVYSSAQDAATAM